MAFQIDQFKAEVSKGGGFAMGNLYKIFLPALTGETRGMSTICTAVNLPGRQITSTDHAMGTVNKKIATGYLSDDVTVNFHILNDFKIKDYFERWQNLAHNQNSKEVGYFNEYTHPVIIQTIKKGTSFPVKKKKLFDSGKIPSSIGNRLPRLGPLDLAQGEIDLDFITGDKITYTCILDNAYPTTMSAIELGNDKELIELSVQLSYKDWRGRKGDSVTENDGFAEGIAGALIQRFL